MTKGDFHNIWTQKVLANGPWYPSASSDDTLRLYRGKLSKYSSEVLSGAIDKLLIDEIDRLPSVGLFIRYCEWTKEEFPEQKPIPYCPCCAGTGWIYFKSDSMVRECDHIRKPLSEEVCVNFDCDPDKNTPCPLGVQHYNTKKTAFMNSIKDNPDYKLGLSFLNKKETIEDIVAGKINNMPEAEENGEEKIPF